MSKYRFTPFTGKRFPILAALFAVLLSLNFATTAFAGNNPVVNGDFVVAANEHNAHCSLAGWDRRGEVRVVDGTAEGLYAADPCVAKITRNQNGVSSISQTFVVPTQTPDGFIPPNTLELNMWAKSANGFQVRTESPEVYAAQTITVYDANNKIIYTKSHNYDLNTGEKGRLRVYLGDYAGQQVRLEIKVELDHKNPKSPQWATLYVDRILLLARGVSPVEDNFSW